MSNWKHIFCLIYGISFISLFFVAGLNLLGAVQIEWASFTVPTQIFGLGISAFLLSAIRTKDFWKDDPESVRKLKKKIIEMDAKHLSAVAEYCKREQAASEKYSKLEDEYNRIPKPLKSRAKPFSS